MFQDTARDPVTLQRPEFANVNDSSLHNCRVRFREFFRCICTTFALITQFMNKLLYSERNFRQGLVFIYRDALTRNWNRRQLYVEVDMLHLTE